MGVINQLSYLGGTTLYGAPTCNHHDTKKLYISGATPRAFILRILSGKGFFGSFFVEEISWFLISAIISWLVYMGMDQYLLIPFLGE